VKEAPQNSTIALRPITTVVSFGGSWEVAETPDGSTVTYRVAFRTSVPQPAGAIDPMVARVLLRSAAEVVTGLAGPAKIVDGGNALRDPEFPLGR